MIAPGTSIREIEACDHDAVARHWRTAWTATYASMFGEEPVACMCDQHLGPPHLSGMMPEGTRALIALLDGEVVGTICGRQEAGIVYLWGMYVAAGLQRKGIGGALLAELIALFPEALQVQARVVAASRWAVSFYVTQGFAARERLAIRLSDEIETDGLLMVKRLWPSRRRHEPETRP